MHEAQHRGLTCFHRSPIPLCSSRQSYPRLPPFPRLSSDTLRVDIYGILLIARSLHSASLASARIVPEDPRDRERFNLHYRRCQCGAHRAKLRPGFVALFETRPDIAGTIRRPWNSNFRGRKAMNVIETEQLFGALETQPLL